MTEPLSMGYNTLVGVQIALDMFPAKVTLPSGSMLTPVRVFIVDGRVQVYVVANGKPLLHFDRELLSHSGARLRGYKLQVPDGVVEVAKELNDCGCGNPLKSHNPWPGERRYLIPL